MVSCLFEQKEGDGGEGGEEEKYLPAPPYK